MTEPSALELAALKFAKAKAAMEAYANSCATKGEPIDKAKMLGLIGAWREAQAALVAEAKDFKGEAA